MKEIEIKARIVDPEALKKKLLDLDCHFSEPKTQEDIIYLPIGIEYAAITKGTPVVRIRNSEGKITFTLKKRIQSDVELIKMEKEIIVSDDIIAQEIVENMGFYEVVRVSKTRERCDYGGMTICLDKVSGLGDFVEIEKLSKEEGGETTQKELVNFLATLEVDLNDIVTKGYDTLVIEQNK